MRRRAAASTRRVCSPAFIRSIGRCGRAVGGGTQQRGRIRCVGCEPRAGRRGNRVGTGNRPGSAFEKRAQGSGGRLRLYPDRLPAFADAVDA
ncbi:hypothetical protein BN1095_5290001 [Clostridioides difficile]|uniref:Uncharacterized protein n=1 Tax=Clostridioides difficile TaxID=1496 RepID=A0A069AZ29_CLODI|nr:hypothetical protein BN1095_5290001 [Clostridioides difficile]